MDTPKPSSDIPPGLAARYEVLGVLGAGGFGRVLRARDRELGRAVALKLLLAPVDAVMRARFHREAGALARMRHPNILRLYDFGETDGALFMVTELLEGCALSRLPPHADPLPPMLDAAAGLEALHAEGLLHRDVKPDNMIWTTRGRGVLIDLGILFDPAETALTRTGLTPGTLGFFAPEFFRQGAASPASDWYAWGASLYLLLEGRLLVDHGDIAAALQGRPFPAPTFQGGPPRSPAERLAAACLSEDPGARPATVAELEAILEDPEGTEVVEPPPEPDLVPARPPDRIPDPPTRPREGRGPRGGLAVLAALAVLAGAAVSWRALPGEQPGTPTDDAPPREAGDPTTASSPTSRAAAAVHRARADLASHDPAHAFLALRPLGLVAGSAEIEQSDRAYLRALGDWPDFEVLEAWNRYLDAVDGWVAAWRAHGPGTPEASPPGFADLVIGPISHYLEDLALLEAAHFQELLHAWKRMQGVDELKRAGKPWREMASLTRGLLDPTLARVAWTPGSYPDALLALDGYLEASAREPSSRRPALLAEIVRALRARPAGAGSPWLLRAGLALLASTPGADVLPVDQRAAALVGFEEALDAPGPLDAGNRARLLARLLCETIRAHRNAPRDAHRDRIRVLIDQVRPAAAQDPVLARALARRLRSNVLTTSVFAVHPLDEDLAAAARAIWEDAGIPDGEW